MTLALFVYADKPGEMNCSKWDCIYPNNAINALNKPEHQSIAINIDQFSQNDDNTKKLAMQADIIIVERNLFGDTLTSIMYYKVRNKSVISIFDDSYPTMHKENVSYSFWHDGMISYVDDQGVQHSGTMQPHPLTQFYWGNKIVKGIQVPSAYLAKDWEPYNKTYHIPNYIEFERYVGVKPYFPHKKDNIIIGWGGSLSHVASFKDSNVLGALKNVAKKYNNVKIMITGDKRVFDLLSDIPNRQKIYNPFVEEQYFLSLMKTFDIAIAPLAGDYDRRRSRIKVLEFMALQMPWIASDYPPYEGFHDYGSFVNNTVDDWEEKLCDYVDNIEQKREYAKGIPYEYAKTQSYSANIEHTLEIYKNIIETPYTT